MLSLTHILLLVLVVVLLTGPSRLPRLGHSLFEGLREFKKALGGREDIDVTESVKHIRDDE